MGALRRGADSSGYRWAQLGCSLLKVQGVFGHLGGGSLRYRLNFEPPRSQKITRDYNGFTPAPI